mgnify:CR=1 FL=1
MSEMKNLLHSFDEMERAIVYALKDYADACHDDGKDLSLLIAVLSKLSASAALVQGRTEDEFIEPMRETFRILERREQEQRANTH